MKFKMRTLDDIENDRQAKMAELSGVETRLLELHDKEHEIRTELQHLEVQKERLESAQPAAPGEGAV